MSERIPKTSLLVDISPAHDLELRPILRALESASKPVYDLLRPEKDRLEVEKTHFFESGRTGTPDLKVRDIDEDELVGRWQKLRQLKKELAASNQNPAVKQAYRWAINEELANLQMVRASAAGDMRAFRAYNKFIYGEPNPEIFAATVDWFRSEAEALLADSPPAVALTAHTVLEELPDAGGNKDLLKPAPEVFDAVKEAHFRADGYFALLLAGVELPDTAKIDQTIGDPLIYQALKNIGASSYKKVTARGKAWSVNNARGEVAGPDEYNWVRKRFIGLPLGHEMRHILEYQNGLRQPLQLLARGLDRYEQGSEGREVITEQVVYDSFEDFAKTVRWQDIMRRHLAISLAEGAASGGEPMPFAQVFKIINAVDRMHEVSKKPDDVVGAETKADQRSWDLLSDRVFKGTDGQSGAYQKDKVYLEGNVACWKLATAYPEMIELGDLGKFDITNPRHIAIAQQFGILPEVEG